MFHGWGEAGLFHTVTQRHILVVGLVIYPENLSDQDTGEDLEKISLCKNPLVR